MHKKFTQPFSLSDSLTPKGDQVSAISQIISGFNHQQQQTLLGVTGSGKTFTMANVIQEIALPTLIIAHNKTLAAQLYEEFRELFPNNAVEYFVSYYDYYQPEAYVPSSDTFIDKDSAINEAIDRMRHSATRALFERNDVIIVASVSCIYGLGSAEAYLEMLLLLNVGQEIDRDHVLRKLVELQYVRNDTDFFRGVFRVRGDVVEIFPAHEEDRAIRIEWFGDQIDSMSYIDPLRGKRLETLVKTAIYPNTHYAVTPEARTRALGTISQELKERLIVLQENNRFVEVQRLQERTEYDLEMIQQLGYCNGIENYSRHLSGRGEGVAPPTLIDYFPNEFLLCIDESHQTVPQVGAMYKGDRSRKSTLVEYGFRLPSALDNRPLQFDEFTALQHKVLYVSATPGDYEIERSDGVIVEQLIRPTGLLDPPIDVLPAKTQIDDLLEQIRTTVAKNERVLVTTLTKRMSEDLTEFLAESGVKVRYLHSDIKTIERTEILHDLRRGEFDVLVGINLLREGIDLPEVSLVAILDADKEGFLRSYRSLVQTIGRAARNINGRAILYADKITKSMQLTIEETERRREKQHQHNLDHHIVPTSITKPIRSLHPEALVGKDAPKMKGTEDISYAEIPARMKVLKQEMLTAAKALNFELAAELRDELKALEKMHLALS